MRDISICIVGAGGSYTPEIIEGILERDEDTLPVGELRLTDVNPGRLATMEGLTRRMFAARGRNISVWAEPDLAKAAKDTDFVIAQIRVGGMAARRIDETIPLKYGVIGQETTGPGGMFKALRTIPVMVGIARTITDVAPNATILNYTNPSGIVTEAVLNHSLAKFMGLCSSIPTMQDDMARRLEPRFGVVRTYSVGLNHLGFIHRILANGIDVTADAIAWLSRLEGQPESYYRWMELARKLGAVPTLGYSNYYFHRGAALAAQRAAAKTRAQQVMEIESEVLAEAADPNVNVKPAALAKRGGEGYSRVTFAILTAILHDREDEVVMSTLNRGAVNGLPDAAAVEVTCRVDASGADPLTVGDMPLAFRGLVQAVKAHESLTVEAAMTQSREIALRALLAHPLVSDIEIAEPMLDELLAAHGLDYR